MRSELLDLLACPECRKRLNLVDAEPPVEDGHTMAGTLVCSACRRRFPIVSGIPRLLPGEANRGPERDKTASRFAYEWTRFADFDLEEETVSMATWFKPRALEELEGLTVLDAGCGMGRHAVIASAHQVARIVGVDLGDAVEAAFANTRHLPAVCIVQGDLYHPPVAPGAFDAAYSLGVLHHLPDPQRGFRAVATSVRPGGWFHAWLYGREGNTWIVTGVSTLRRLTQRMPLGPLKLLSALVAVPLTVSAKTVYRLPGLGRRLPYAGYLQWLSKFTFAKIHAIVFDHALAPVAHYLSRAEVEALVEGSGWRIEGLEHSRGMSWGVTARAAEGGPLA